MHGILELAGQGCTVHWCFSGVSVVREASPFYLCEESVAGSSVFFGAMKTRHAYL